jgi:hypothetical protein
MQTDEDDWIKTEETIDNIYLLEEIPVLEFEAPKIVNNLLQSLDQPLGPLRCFDVATRNEVLG